MADLRKSILIVEDEPIVALDAEASVEHSGHRVAGVARAVEDALRVLDRSTVDAVVLDFNLGDETSLPVARELERRRIPYVVVSGARGADLRACGFNDDVVFTKPVDYDRVLRTLVAAAA